jgi:hypothetical protein
LHRTDLQAFLSNTAVFNQPNPMRTIKILLLCTISLLLNACTSTLRSQVSSFNQWPDAISNTPNYIFQAPTLDDNGIEYNQYIGVLGEELSKAGLSPALNGAADLKVTLRYGTIPIDIRTFSDPFFFGPQAFACFSGPFPRRRGFSRPFFSSACFNSSFYTGSNFDVTQRFFHRVQIGITRISDNKKLFETTVENTGNRSAQNEVVPFMIKSAFTRFPGKNGETFDVELPLNPK